MLLSGGTAGGISAWIQRGSSRDIAVATALGAGVGALLGLTFGAAGTIVVGGLSGRASNLVGQLIVGGDLNCTSLVASTIAGATGGAAALLVRTSSGALAEATVGGFAAAQTQALFDLGNS